MFQGTAAGNAVYWAERGIQWCSSHVIAKSMQKEVFGLLSVIRLLVKWAEVEMID